VAGPQLVNGMTVETVIVGRDRHGSINANVACWECVATAGAGAQVSDVATALMTQALGIYTQAVSDTTEFLYVSAQEVSGLGVPLSPQQLANFPAATTGALTGEPLPPMTSGVILTYSGTTGAKGRGRQFLFVADEPSNAATGHPSATYLTQMGNWAVVLRSNLTAGAGANTATLRPVVHSKLPPTGAFYPILSATPSSQWSTVRRRKPGRGI